MTLNFNIIQLAAAAIFALAGSVGAAAVHGVEEFSANGTFVVPKGVKVINVELWAGGGAGGSSHNDANDSLDAPGGGGGAGGFARGTFNVKANQVYLVNVAAGGTIATISFAGGSGGPSNILESVTNSQIIAAEGGVGGGPAIAGLGGTGGPGGFASSQGDILRRTGESGNAGVASPFISFPGFGGPATQGSVNVNIPKSYPATAAGGDGGGPNSSVPNGHAGGRGHIIISW